MLVLIKNICFSESEMSPSLSYNLLTAREYKYVKVSSNISSVLVSIKKEY